MGKSRWRSAHSSRREAIVYKKETRGLFQGDIVALAEPFLVRGKVHLNRAAIARVSLCKYLDGDVQAHHSPTRQNT